MKGRVLIVHALFDVLGGGEFFALKLSQALAEQGFDVEILTATPVDQGKLRNIFGEVKTPRISVQRIKEAELLSKLMPGRLVRLRRLVIYRKLLPIIEEKKKKYDILIDTQSNLPTPVDISYIHFPTLIGTTSVENKGLQWFIYNQLIKQLARGFKNPRSGRILTNSTWTAHMIYKVHGVIADVVYPPVDVEYFASVSDSYKKEKLVVTVSRFTPEKKLHKILDVARELPEYSFVIVGSTGLGSEKVIEELKERIDKLRLRNVELKPNLPRSQLRELLSKALFYLHPEFTEHFGIAVIEAMSAGCIPIVYRDGGAWHDAVSKISEKLGYSNIGDVPKIIRQIEKKRQLQEELRRRSIEVSKTFSYENFKKNLAEKVYYILKVKKLF
jgi:glycosyltransferase involved in cell wall biosynthesis